MFVGTIDCSMSQTFKRSKLLDYYHLCFLFLLLPGTRRKALSKRIFWWNIRQYFVHCAASCKIQFQENLWSDLFKNLIEAQKLNMHFDLQWQLGHEWNNGSVSLLIPVANIIFWSSEYMYVTLRAVGHLLHSLHWAHSFFWSSLLEKDAD